MLGTIVTIIILLIIFFALFWWLIPLFFGIGLLKKLKDWIMSWFK